MLSTLQFVSLCSSGGRAPWSSNRRFFNSDQKSIVGVAPILQDYQRKNDSRYRTGTLPNTNTNYRALTRDVHCKYLAESAAGRCCLGRKKPPSSPRSSRPVRLHPTVADPGIPPVQESRPCKHLAEAHERISETKETTTSKK